MTVYHYYIALDAILLACSTIAVAFAASGRHFWKTWAGIWRILSTLLIFVFLSIFLGYQASNKLNTDFPELFPPTKRDDSAILLPVSCFLDPDLIDKESPYAPNPQRHLNDAQFELIGRPIKTTKLPQIWLFFFLILALLLGVLAHVLGRRLLSRPKKWLLGFIFLLSLGTDIFCAYHMLKLRLWTSRSGWMADKGEEGYYSIGQLLPLVSLALIVIAAAETFELRCGKRWEDKKHRVPKGYQMI